MSRVSQTSVELVGRSISRFLILLSTLVLGLQGCYNYLPTDFATVPVGEDLRLFVDPEEVPELSEIPATEDLTPVVQGTLVGMEDDALVLRVRVASRQQGFHTVSLGQSIRVPHDGIISAQLRVLDEFKTLGVVSGSGSCCYPNFRGFKSHQSSTDDSRRRPS